MSIGIVSMLTPLEERIDRWATSGNATRILLHPEDYVQVNKDILETKYNLPVDVLGGDRGLREFLNRDNKDNDEMEVVESQFGSVEDILDEE